MTSVDTLPSLDTLTLGPKESKPRDQLTSKEPKALKKPFVMYLGVAILSSALQPIMSLEVVQTLFAKYPELKKKEEFHITLLFFPKKCADKEVVVDEFRQFIAQHGDEVSITITGIGYHEGTCALQVSPIILTKESNITVPWIHEKQNHITIALEEGKNAKNSIIAVMKKEEYGDYPGDFIPLEPFAITGKLQTF